MSQKMIKAEIVKRCQASIRRNKPIAFGRVVQRGVREYRGVYWYQHPRAAGQGCTTGRAVCEFLS